MATKLKTEINTSEMEDRIHAAFSVSDYAGADGDFSSSFEHGQWWIETDKGRVYSVVDAVGGAAIDGFDFECVSEGEEI